MTFAEAGRAWQRAMRAGDLEAAWRATDAIEARRAAEFDPSSHLVWDGRRPDGRRVAVRALHGLGDAIQFSRYLPRLEAIAAELVTAVPPALLRLFRRQPGFGRVVDGWREFCWPDDVVTMEIMELAYVFRSTVETIPPPGLVAPPFDHLPAREPGKKRVAIFPASSGWGGKAPVPLRAFLPLLDRADVRLCDFLPEGGPRLPGSTRLSRWTTDVADLAGALREMDLVIAVDTMAAHLAASLGRPVWLLLEAAADWRWMEGRSDSPWYPRLRVFRRGADEDWSAVIARAVSGLDDGAIP